FYRDLEFGTGGLRGIMGVGSNRMNRYTLGAATQGLSNYLRASFPGEKIKVAIAHDSRNNSPEFARITASVFSANGIEVYFFEALRPTPLLSFTIRHLGCKSGVVITASHNPKEYNGYKAYWTDGAQVTAPNDKNIIAEVNRITDINQVKFKANESLIHSIGKDLDEAYMKEVLALSVSSEAIKNQHDLKIVYTPLHGTGITLVPEVLKRFGFTNVTIVDAQATPDGNFPTVVYPNPEEKEAMSLALRTAEEIDADLVLATDPDADRVGIAVKDTSGKFVLMNGNQTGALLMYYLIKAWEKAGKLTGKEFIVKTIVTTDLIDRICERHQVKCYNTLTGFKYIASIIRELEGKETYIAGCEESYGYSIGDFVRDKDGIAACAMIAELTAFAKVQGKSVYELLLQIYQEFGFYKEDLLSITKKGKSGAEEIVEMMKGYRKAPIQSLGNSKVVEVMDYELQMHKNLQTGEEKKIDMPKSNVMQFVTEDGTKVSARPSGTEPKIKFYVSVNVPLAFASDFAETERKANEKIAAIMQEISTMA
ncbi:MAG: phospho-sugar mutase, partial [Flavobacterium sp.]